MTVAHITVTRHNGPDHAARLQCGLPPISAERLAELRGMSIVEILHSARLQAAVAQDEAPVLPKGSVIF